MKKVRIYVVLLAALTVILLLASAGQARRTHRSEINIINDTDTQISFFITTEKYGRKQWTWKKDHNSYPSIDGVRLRVNGDETIEIADWGKAYIDDVAEFEDGLWKLRLRHAHRELRRK
jgi:hypothetical protein